MTFGLDFKGRTRRDPHPLVERTTEAYSVLDVVWYGNVPYDLDCDTCDYSRTVDAESSAYTAAKDHESDHPDHFVLIYATE